MQEVVVGAELKEGGLEFFGVDEINALLQQGHRIVKVEPGDVIVTDVDEEEEPEDDEEGAYAFLGFQFKLTVEEK